jgi:hypothetical protein
MDEAEFYFRRDLSMPFLWLLLLWDLLEMKLRKTIPFFLLI